MKKHSLSTRILAYLLLFSHILTSCTNPDSNSPSPHPNSATSSSSIPTSGANNVTPTPNLGIPLSNSSFNNSDLNNNSSSSIPTLSSNNQILNGEPNNLLSNNNLSNSVSTSSSNSGNLNNSSSSSAGRGSLNNLTSKHTAIALLNQEKGSVATSKPFTVSSNSTRNNNNRSRSNNEKSGNNNNSNSNNNNSRSSSTNNRFGSNSNNNKNIVQNVATKETVQIGPLQLVQTNTNDKKHHVTKIEFSGESITAIAPHLIDIQPWENVPAFAVMTGKNGSGKTQLLKYIDHVLSKSKHAISGINVLWRGPDYINAQVNNYHTNNPRFFLEQEGRLQLMEALRKYAEWKERNETEAIPSHLGNALDEKTLQDEAIYQHIKAKIDQGLIPNSTDQQRWEEEIRYCIESYKDYCPQNPNVNEPARILAQAFSIHEQGNKQLIERYDQPQYSSELYSSYCEKEKKERSFDTLNAFNVSLQDKSYRTELINFYLSKKLKRIPLWEEINSILETYGFTYQVDFIDVEDSSNQETGSKKFVIKRQVGEKNVIIRPEDLSSGERLMLDLMSWLFYFQGFSVDGTDPAAIKNVDIMLLDEPDRHLDPALSKILYEVITKEFVEKRNIQVIMTTHRLDTVAMAPKNSIYEMGSSKLEPNSDAAFSRMSSNLIQQSINSRSAAAALAGGALTVIKDVNQVLVENEDDVKFFNIIYQKFLAALPYLAKLTKLIFMPVGISLKDTTEKIKELQSSIDKMAEILNSDSIQTTIKTEFENLLAKSKNLIKTLGESIDRSGGSSQVKKRVNEISLYEGKYDEQGKVIQGGHLKRLETTKHRSQVIWGMIDNDSATRSGKSNAEGNVHALDAVYSFENYLCMPLNLFYYLKESYMKNKRQDENWESLKSVFKNFNEEEASQEDLQKISDQMVGYLLQQYQSKSSLFTHQGKGRGKFFTENDFKSENRVTVTLINGKKISCPKLFFTKRGHDLLQEISNIILGQPDEHKMQQLLFNTLEKMPVAFLPESLLIAIKRLQNSEEINKEVMEEGEKSNKSKKADHDDTLEKIIIYLSDSQQLEKILASQSSKEEEQKIELILPGVKKNDVIAFCVRQLEMQEKQIASGQNNTFTLTLSTQKQVMALQEKITNFLYNNRVLEKVELHERSVSKDTTSTVLPNNNNNSNNNNNNKK